eukprot:TRINITY_DN3716_c0_g1_i1.p1 TRINITY_DN3716_c0_g1~~TRINITY_DN3716_c0_g1_i1.p1  ORF type:complete len:511 (+),score=94.55 TRINITY_DN3716_c0_g1_i1:43-1575(+)
MAGATDKKFLPKEWYAKMLNTFRTVPCKETFHAAGYDKCPCYHNAKDQRRPVLKNGLTLPFAYQLSECKNGVERDFHPENYKKGKCKNFKKAGQCVHGDTCSRRHVRDGIDYDVNYVPPHIISYEAFKKLFMTYKVSGPCTDPKCSATSPTFYECNLYHTREGKSTDRRYPPTVDEYGEWCPVNYASTPSVSFHPKKYKTIDCHDGFACSHMHCCSFLHSKAEEKATNEYIERLKNELSPKNSNGKKVEHIPAAPSVPAVPPTLNSAADFPEISAVPKSENSENEDVFLSLLAEKTAMPKTSPTKVERAESHLKVGIPKPESPRKLGVTVSAPEIARIESFHSSGSADDDLLKETVLQIFEDCKQQVIREISNSQKNNFSEREYRSLLHEYQNLQTRNDELEQTGKMLASHLKTKLEELKAINLSYNNIITEVETLRQENVKYKRMLDQVGGKGLEGLEAKELTRLIEVMRHGIEAAEKQKIALEAKQSQVFFQLEKTFPSIQNFFARSF